MPKLLSFILSQRLPKRADLTNRLLQTGKRCLHLATPDVVIRVLIKKIQVSISEKVSSSRLIFLTSLIPEWLKQEHDSTCQPYEQTLSRSSLEDKKKTLLTGKCVHSRHSNARNVQGRKRAGIPLYFISDNFFSDKKSHLHKNGIEIHLCV